MVDNIINYTPTSNANENNAPHCFKCIFIWVQRFGGRGGSRFSDRFGGGGGMRGKSSGLGDRLHKPRWDLERLPKFEKNFYHEHPLTSGRPDVSVSYTLCVRYHSQLYIVIGNVKLF